MGTVDTAFEVNADETNGPVAAILDQIRPSIRLWVGFAEVGGCERFEVENIQIVIYENGASRFYDQQFSCIELTTGDGLLIEEMSDTALYDVRVRGLNENDEYTYAYDEDEVEVSAGAATEVTAELALCSGLCEAP